MTRTSEFMAKIGSVGGKKSGKGGFWYLKHVAKDLDRIRQIGSKGGKKKAENNGA
jgi:general stress protein YciG